MVTWHVVVQGRNFIGTVGVILTAVLAKVAIAIGLTRGLTRWAEMNIVASPPSLTTAHVVQASRTVTTTANAQTLIPPVAKSRLLKVMMFL